MSNRRKLLVPLVVVALSIALAVLLIRLKPTAERQVVEPPLPTVRVMTAEESEVELVVRSQGTVRPRTQTALAAQVSGQVERVSSAFANGALFRRGQVLIELDPREARAALAQAEAQVAQAQVRLEREQAEADLVIAEWQDLGEGEPTPLVLRQPQLAEASASLAAAQAGADKARLDLERTTIRAPFTGRVRRKLVDVGQFVPRGTPLAEIFATDSAEVLLPVPKNELAYLELDLGARDLAPLGATLHAEIGDRPLTWRARIARTGAEIDAQTRMLELYAEVDDPLALAAGAEHTPLPMGLFVGAEIEGRTAPGVVVLPRVALRGPDRLLIVDDDDRLRFRRVEVLRTEDERVLIAGGLSSGERVCVSPLETPVEGMRVQPVTDAARAGGHGAETAGAAR